MDLDCRGRKGMRVKGDFWIHTYPTGGPVDGNLAEAGLTVPVGCSSIGLGGDEAPFEGARDVGYVCRAVIRALGSPRGVQGSDLSGVSQSQSGEVGEKRPKISY